MNILIPMIDSAGVICVYRDKKGRLALPHIEYDMRDTSITVLARYLAALGWDWSDLHYLGPIGFGFPDGYFQIIHNGAIGQAPHGHRVVWMSPSLMLQHLNAGRFERPTFVDRAISLYAARCGIS